MTHIWIAYSLLCVFIIINCFSHRLERRSRDAEAQRLDKWVLELTVRIYPLPTH